jgi:hypothetical protein
MKRVEDWFLGSFFVGTASGLIAKSFTAQPETPAFVLASIFRGTA